MRARPTSTTTGMHFDFPPELVLAISPSCWTETCHSNKCMLQVICVGLAAVEMQSPRVHRTSSPAVNIVIITIAGWTTETTFCIFLWCTYTVRVRCSADIFFDAVIVSLPLTSILLEQRNRASSVANTRVVRERK